MNDIVKNTAAWAEESASLPLPEWDALPTIPLYMDQVLLYLSDQLASFQREGASPLLTSAMVNNYVKTGAVPRPEKKKYGRRHLAALYTLCMLKQVLSLQDIKTLLAEATPIEELYGLFLEAHRAAMGEVSAGLAESLSAGQQDPRQMALRLAAEANARRAAAERLLMELAQQEGNPAKE